MDYTKKLEAFADACQRHDITYAYSDDHRCYTRGRMERAAIETMAVGIERADAVRIWNAAVDRKLRFPEDRKQYYWGND